MLSEIGETDKYDLIYMWNLKNIKKENKVHNTKQISGCQRQGVGGG